MKTYYSFATVKGIKNIVLRSGGDMGQKVICEKVQVYKFTCPICNHETFYEDLHDYQVTCFYCDNDFKAVEKQESN